MDDIKKNYLPSKVAEAIEGLEYCEEGLLWCIDRESAISAAVASIAFQWKMVKHDNSIAKGWGQGVLNLLKISNEALHGVTHNPGQQLRNWHAVNAGIYKYSIFFHYKQYTLFRKIIY